MIAFRTAVIAFFLAATSVSNANAQDDPRKVEAQRLFDEGLRLHDAHQDDQALERFRRAHATYASPNTLYNIARLEEEAGDRVRAVRHYLECLRNPLLTPQNRASAEKYLKVLEPTVGRVELWVSPAALVRVDGQVLEPSSDRTYIVEPGEHAIEVQDNGKVEKKSVSVPPNRTTVVKFLATTRETTGPEPPPTPTTRTTSKIWPPPTVTLVLAGVAAAGFITAIPFALEAKSKDDDVQSTRNQLGAGFCSDPASKACTDWRALRSDQGRSATISDIAMGVGVGASALAVAWWILFPRQRTETTIVAPTLGSHSAGAMLTHSF